MIISVGGGFFCVGVTDKMRRERSIVETIYHNCITAVPPVNKLTFETTTDLNILAIENIQS